MSLRQTFELAISQLLRPIYAGSGLILMYHRVLPEENRPRVKGHAALEVSPEILEEAIQFFQARGYTAISLGQLYQGLKQTTPLPEPFVVYTFDDGYIDNLIHAYPIFKRYGIPFSINIATSFPDRQAVLWWYLLEDLILTINQLTFTLDDRNFQWECRDAAGKALAYAEVRRMLKYATPQEFSALCQQLFVSRGIDLYQPVNMAALSWDQIRLLAADPLVTISSHTARHFTLNRLSAEELRSEIVTAHQRLTEELHQPVSHMAYPYGMRNEAGEREFQMAQELGYKTALTTRYGNIFRQHKMFLTSLPRYDMAKIQGKAALTLLANGWTACRMNRFRRVISV